MKTITTLLCAMLLGTVAFGQSTQTELTNRVNLLFGLAQPMVGGFNVEGNVFYKRLAFDYSHGASLDFSNDMLSGAEADQGLAVHLPYTTGFGVGYRFTEWFNLRVEPKWHRFEIYYDSDVQTESNRVGAYNTFTLGLGAYVTWMPFKNKENLLRGIMIAPSLRYWPNVSTSLDDDSFDYANRVTNQTETHDAMNIGLGNTPLIVNVSVGYSIKF
ncbi:MAG: hypothetical protein ABJF04_00640 [Reichenbachiella sp.]|uniref:hypothetical protein n=1 Tax=Reichenbachiella sp. TaxID=2184521 RepID=UPI0032644579